MTRTLLATTLFALLAACSNDAATPPTEAAAPAPAPAMDQPAEDVPPATAPGTPAPEATAPTPGDALALSRFDGYGDMHFGTTAGDMPKAWGGELTVRGKDENASCYFMTPKSVTDPGELAFMVGDGKFARYGTRQAKLAAPGGGKVGMTKAEVAALYPGRIEEQPHKYGDGQYLRIKDAAGGAGVLLFETDGKTDAAKVTQWRVGVPPQVDYVEGCA